MFKLIKSDKELNIFDESVKINEKSCIRFLGNNPELSVKDNDL